MSYILEFADPLATAIRDGSVDGDTVEMAGLRLDIVGNSIAFVTVSDPQYYEVGFVRVTVTIDGFAAAEPEQAI